MSFAIAIVPGTGRPFYSWFQLRLNITCCVAFTESSAEVLQTHANYLATHLRF